VRSGEIYFSKVGLHGSYDQWVGSGSPDLLTEIRQDIHDLISTNPPLPLPESAEKELKFLEKRARANE
jgi:hypothetical protein